MRLIILCCLILFSSCLTDKAAVRKIAKIKALKPHLFSSQETLDTLVRPHIKEVIIPQLVLTDTIIQETKLIDTVYVKSEQASTTLFVTRTDTVTSYVFNTIIDERTLEVMCIDTIAINRNIITTIENSVKWWYYALAAFLVGMFLMWFLMRKIGNN